jgi:hypothetical protein
MFFRLFTRALWKTHAWLKPSEIEAYLWKFEEVQIDVEKKIQDRLVQRRARRYKLYSNLYSPVGAEPQVCNGAWPRVQDPSDERPAIWTVSSFYQLFHGYQFLGFSLKHFFEPSGGINDNMWYMHKISDEALFLVPYLQMYVC